MNDVFREDGFRLYHLPSGKRISPEEFSEFESAYRSFTTTTRFSNDVQAAIERTQKPIVLVEGTIDVQYIEKAASLLGYDEVLERVELSDGGGAGNLKNIWKGLSSALSSVVSQKVVLLLDCDKRAPAIDLGDFHRRTIPLHGSHPIQKGIENLFERPILERARQHNGAFLDIVKAHSRTTRGETVHVPEEWSVNEDEKKNLCDWICLNATTHDFQCFQGIFDLLERVIGEDSDSTLQTSENWENT